MSNIKERDAELLARTHYEAFQKRIVEANPGIPFFSWDKADAPVRELYLESARDGLAALNERQEKIALSDLRVDDWVLVRARVIQVGGFMGPAAKLHSNGQQFVLGPGDVVSRADF